MTLGHGSGAGPWTIRRPGDPWPRLRRGYLDDLALLSALSQSRCRPAAQRPDPGTAERSRDRLAVPERWNVQDPKTRGACLCAAGATGRERTSALSDQAPVT